MCSVIDNELKTYCVMFTLLKILEEMRINVYTESTLGDITVVSPVIMQIQYFSMQMENRKHIVWVEYGFLMNRV